MNHWSKKMSKDAWLKIKRRHIITPHPLSVSIIIRTADDYKLEINVKYMKELHIVIVSCEVKDSENLIGISNG